MRTEPLVAESAQSGKDSSRFMSTDHGAVVIDISSDDEEEEQDLGLGGRRDEETDEVVVLDALPAPFVKRLKQSGEFVGGGLVDDDDDCLVLESDPDKPVLVESDQGRGGDDLLIVAEKGQLACRDYPHPRHLCANFPFISSLHEKYCKLCHCYVCDSPAPCNYWANGDLTTDHCNSTDKEPSWRALRQSFKLVATHSQMYKDNSSSGFPTFRGRAPPIHHSNSNPILASISQSNLLQPCSTTPITKTNLIDCRRYLPATLSCHNQRYNHYTPKGQPLRRETGLTYARKRSRRDGALEAHFTTLDSPYSASITASANNHNPNTVPITLQSPRWSEVGQWASQTPSITSSGDSTSIMQAAVASQFVPSLITAADVNLKTWQDIVAHATSESGIPEFHLSQI
ncbi:uncharacterized protein LOC122025338 [Zingiber officinale]|uniref:uncharacterized protein LOC122025338 n=1 Tax=Zingiber officinale TaxID=94328 RepID=UPI001C4BF628|nr:uncharacterized protein LOC122025338 [Zingiber officinale]